jgi:hypothetical protein
VVDEPLSASEVWVAANKLPEKAKAAATSKNIATAPAFLASSLLLIFFVSFQPSLIFSLCEAFYQSPS